MFRFLKRKRGQGMVEFTLVLCIVCIASGAILTTQESTRNLILAQFQRFVVNILRQKTWNVVENLEPF